MVGSWMKDKDGTRSETPQFRYLEPSLYLAEKPKWSSETPERSLLRLWNIAPENITSLGTNTIK